MSSSEDKCYATVILIRSYDEHITPNAGAPGKIELNESKKRIRKTTDNFIILESIASSYRVK